MSSPAEDPVRHPGDGHVVRGVAGALAEGVAGDLGEGLVGRPVAGLPDGLPDGLPVVGLPVVGVRRSRRSSWSSWRPRRWR